MMQTARTPVVKVPTRSLEAIEREAERLLAEYEETISSSVTPAVPVDEIAIHHLALKLELADLHDVLQVPRSGTETDILGAMFFEHSAILIDNSLDPEVDPAKIGRYRFSVGHEVGHWWLHRNVIARRRRANPDQPDFICRQSEFVTVPVEFQAENFASCLLMPRRLVLEEWGKQRGGGVFSFNVYEHGSRELRRMWSGLKVDGQEARTMFAWECDRVFDAECAELTKTFQVSKQAMRLRLEALGLLLRGGARPQGRLLTA
jgi:Zn-dependent peptidase ImmA (M78 family)